MPSTLESLIKDDASWRGLLSLPSSTVPEDDIHSRAQELATLVKEHNELTDYIVGEVFGQAFDNPRNIDAILSIFNQLAEAFNGDQSYSAYGFTGRAAVLKALYVELLEMSQTPGQPIVGRGPYNVSCPINDSEDINIASKRIVDYAAARNKWIITHVVNARQSVLAPFEANLADNFEFELAVIGKALGLETTRGAPDETDLLNGLITIICCGKHLVTSCDKQRMASVRTALQTSLRTESNFRLKYYMAAALQVLEGAEEWTSGKLFDTTNWVF